MESTGSAGNVQVTNEVAAAVAHVFTFGNRRVVDVKGKGPTLTWRLIGLREDALPIQMPTAGVPRYMTPEVAEEQSRATSPNPDPTTIELSNMNPSISGSLLPSHLHQPHSPDGTDTRPTIKYQQQTLLDRFRILFPPQPHGRASV